MKLPTQIPFSNDENIPPPTLVRGTQYFCFIKIVDIIVGEYEPRVVYKRYNVVGNGRAVYLKLPVRFMALIIRFKGFSMAVMSHIFFVHTRLVPVIATVIKHTYLVQRTP